MSNTRELHGLQAEWNRQVDEVVQPPYGITEPKPASGESTTRITSVIPTRTLKEMIQEGLRDFTASVNTRFDLLNERFDRMATTTQDPCDVRTGIAREETGFLSESGVPPGTTTRGRKPPEDADCYSAEVVSYYDGDVAVDPRSGEPETAGEYLRRRLRELEVARAALLSLRDGLSTEELLGPASLAARALGSI